jgi:AraC-like DNA-binding protein
LDVLAPGLIDRYARSMIGNAASKGYDYDTLSRSLDLPARRMVDEHARFGPDELRRISRNLKLMMGDEFCGFTESPCRVGAFETMFGMTIRSGTLGAALRRAFCFYDGYTDDIRFTLLDDGEFATVQMRLAHPQADRYNFLYEWWFIVWLRLSGWLVDAEIPVIAVDFPHPQAGELEEYAEAFHGNCRFSQSAARFTFSTRWLERRIERRVEDMAGFLEPSGFELGEATGPGASFKTLLKGRLRRHLDATRQMLSIEEAAAEYRVSSQTLRRRLERECTSYRLLKEEVRRETALALLAGGRISVGEASIRAGYAEVNGLSRALKSWTGLSPSELIAAPSPHAHMPGRST